MPDGLGRKLGVIIPLMRKAERPRDGEWGSELPTATGDKGKYFRFMANKLSPGGVTLGFSQ